MKKPLGRAGRNQTVLLQGAIRTQNLLRSQKEAVRKKASMTACLFDRVELDGKKRMDHRVYRNFLLCKG